MIAYTLNEVVFVKGAYDGVYIYPTLYRKINDIYTFLSRDKEYLLCPRTKAIRELEYYGRCMVAYKEEDGSISKLYITRLSTDTNP